jgi:hypothetical protein
VRGRRKIHYLLATQHRLHKLYSYMPPVTRPLTQLEGEPSVILGIPTCWWSLTRSLSRSTTTTTAWSFPPPLDSVTATKSISSVDGATWWLGNALISGSAFPDTGPTWSHAIASLLGADTALTTRHHRVERNGRSCSWPEIQLIRRVDPRTERFAVCLGL